jgi:hypothetical protein
MEYHAQREGRLQCSGRLWCSLRPERNRIRGVGRIKAQTNARAMQTRTTRFQGRATASSMFAVEMGHRHTRYKFMYAFLCVEDKYALEHSTCLRTDDRPKKPA